VSHLNAERHGALVAGVQRLPVRRVRLGQTAQCGRDRAGARRGRSGGGGGDGSSCTEAAAESAAGATRGCGCSNGSGGRGCCGGGEPCVEQWQPAELRIACERV
jgi:hypothetical protein